MRLYRLRSVPQYTIDELKNNYLYFATPEELNDPMEGFAKLYFKGDRVLWQNYLKHYLLVLFKKVYAVINNLSSIEERLMIEGYIIEEPVLESVFKNAYSSFLKEEDVGDFLKYAELCHELHIEELKFLVGILHHYAYYHVIHSLYAVKVLNWEYREKPNYSGFFMKLLELRKTGEEEFKKYHLLFGYANHINDNNLLAIAINNGDKIDSKINYYFISEFINHFFDSLYRLICLNPCIASFMENYKSPALWAYYAAGHTGVCLVFDDENASKKEICFTLRKEDDTYQVETRRVSYRKNTSSVDFFKSLQCEQNEEYWFSDGKKKSNRTKKSAQDLYHTLKEQKKNSNALFFNKLPAWREEKEHRLLLNSKQKYIPSDKASRKYEYDFRLLKGIIFGIRTDYSTKLKIITTIKEKCEKTKRTDFEFYQAYYDKTTGLIKTAKLEL